MFMPPIILLVAINLIGDAGCFFDNKIYEKVANNILEGKETVVSLKSPDERFVKKLLIEKMNKSIDCVAVGSSLVLYIGANSVEAKTFYNLGVSAAIFYDNMAIFGLLNLNNVNFKKVIICIDPGAFVKNNFVKNYQRAKPYLFYSDYMIKVLKGQNTNSSSAFLSYIFQLAQNNPLFSIAYFRVCCKTLINSVIESIELKSSEENKNTIAADVISYNFGADGSRHFSLKEENMTGLELKKKSKQYKSFYILEGNLEILKKKVEIVFWYHPFPPALWDNVDWNKYPAVKELDAWSRKIAKEKGIKTVGSYNPHECGVTDDCFADPRHLKNSAIEKYFRF